VTLISSFADGRPGPCRSTRLKFGWIAPLGRHWSVPYSGRARPPARSSGNVRSVSFGKLRERSQDES
jgi:hypothetical protein